VNGRPHVSAFSVAAETDQETALPAIGSAAYMAPELFGAAGFGGGPEVDVWSLGAQMYEALCGSHPFGPTMERGPIQSLRERAPEVPGAICDVVDRCLREDPQERYADAGELLAAINEAGRDGEEDADRVFVSHSSKDRAFVEQELIPVLERSRNPTWYAKKDIKSASVWERTVIRGLVSCPWFLLVMSPRSAKSDWVRDEVHWAVQHRPNRILPLLFEPVDPYLFHIRIPRIQFVDFSAEPAAGRRDLIERLRRGGNPA
jgi:serine/threonine protein kinase